jgi:hypothetical protein
MENIIRYNNLPSSIFSIDTDASEGSMERAKIVSAGRLLMADRGMQDAKGLAIKHEGEPRLNSEEYKQYNDDLKERMFVYCAKVFCKSTGEDAPKDFADFQRLQRRFLRDKGFLRVLAGVVRDIITPVLPATISDAMDSLAQTVYVPLGETLEVDVLSNDFPVFQDDSWGAPRSKPANRLYDAVVTLNPKPKTAKMSVKWYQLVANNADLGRFFNALAAGMYNKIMAMWINTLVAASTNSRYIPSALQFTFSQANFFTAAQKVAALNRVNPNQVMCFGTPLALSKLLPSGIVNTASINLDAALATMLGSEYIHRGFLTDYLGVGLYAMDQAVIPHTQNTTVDLMIPDTRVWLAAMGGYKPVYIGMEEGTPITIQLDPSETADMSIDILMTISLDVKPVFGSKIATIAPLS